MTNSRMRLLALLACGLVATGGPGDAGTPLLWDWSYSGAGISASGTFTTGDTASAAGRFLITGISGSRNGVAIVGLQPTGTAIPGNAPYAVDNQVGADTPQLSGAGFGFALADGTFANPFFADDRSPKTFLEFFSAAGAPGRDNSERPIGFNASVSQRRP
jgi:hypothetical protein